MRKKRVLLIPFMFLYGTVYSQVNTTPIADPAQVAGISLQGNTAGSTYNVDMFTGIAGVTIPIYSYSVDGLDLSVYLGYNAKGIQVDRKATSVGLGFDLVAGGYIERTINDMPDETNAHDATGTTQILGLLESPGVGWTYYSKEQEYDVFTAVFGGRQVSFVMSGYDNAHVITYPKSELVITPYRPGPCGGDTSSASQLYFTITDEKNNVFEFHKGDIRYSYDGFVDYATTKWYLTKVTTYTGKVITYNYNIYQSQRPGAFVSYYDYNTEYVRESATSPWSIDSASSFPHTWGGIMSHVSSIQYPDGTTVTFNMDNVAGRQDMAGTPSLQSITIKKGYDNTVVDSLKYLFNYAYFNTPITTVSPDTFFSKAEVPYFYPPNPSNTSSQYLSFLTGDGYTATGAAYDYVEKNLRLKLKSIYKLGTDGVTAQLYDSFIYNTTPLPARLSPAQDWYGYYNNQTPSVMHGNGQTLYLSVPQHLYWDSTASGTATYGVDKTPNITYMQAGVLTGIRNGLGGETDFYYKAHTLSDPPSGSLLHSIPSDFEMTGAYDGLCIDKIVHRDGYNVDDNDTTVYTFSNGLRFFQGGYYWYPDTYLNNPKTVSTAIKKRVYLNKPISDFDLYNGSDHGYSYATVVKKGYRSELLSTAIYHFSNMVDGSNPECLDDDKTSNLYHFFPRKNMLQYKMGLLLDTRFYGNADTPISRTVYQYDTATSASSVPQSIRTFYYKYVNGSSITTDTVQRTYNPLNSKIVRLTKRVTTNYSAKDSAVQAVNNQYDNNDNLVLSSWRDSRNDSFIRYLTYAYVYNSSWPQFQIGDRLMKYVGSTDSVISYSLLRPSISGDTARFLSSFASAVTAKFTLNFADTSHAINNDTTYPPYAYLGNNLNPLIKTSECLRYDDHNNPLSNINYLTGVPTSAIWDNRIGQKICDVSNASYGDIAYTSFEGGETVAAYGTADYNKGNWDFDPALLAISTGPSITGRYYYRLSHLGQDSVISVNPLTSGKQYVVSFWAQISQPKVCLGNTTTTALTLQTVLTVGSWTLYTVYITGTGKKVVIRNSGSTDANIDELRLYPANATMTTYTYEPLLGISSICNPLNNIVYYEYDIQGRPSVTRDINGNILSFIRRTVQGADN